MLSLPQEMIVNIINLIQNDLEIINFGFSCWYIYNLVYEYIEHNFVSCSVLRYNSFNINALDFSDIDQDAIINYCNKRTCSTIKQRGISNNDHGKLLYNLFCIHKTEYIYMDLTKILNNNVGNRIFSGIWSDFCHKLCSSKTLKVISIKENSNFNYGMSFSNEYIKVNGHTLQIEYPYECETVYIYRKSKMICNFKKMVNKPIELLFITNNDCINVYWKHDLVIQLCIRDDLSIWTDLL